MTQDTISRQAAIDAAKCGALSAAMVYGRTDAGRTALVETVKEIKALPSAQPEIIRCKDCKYCDEFPEGADNDMQLKCLGIRYGGVYPDWFCEHAERRTDETD